MFITLDDNFYPLELTLKEHILNYNFLLDRSIRSWKTRGRLRIRTERKITDKQTMRELYRFLVWQSKQDKYAYILSGYFANYRTFLYSNLLFLLFINFLFYLNHSTFFYFFRKSCFIRRSTKKKYTFLKT